MSFSSLGLLPSLLDSLQKLEIHEPSPVQRIAIPAVLGGRSVIVVARTGSGKTLAYGLPLLQRLRLVEDAEGAVTERGRPRALVLTGTRELVEQSTRALKSAAHGAKLRVRAVSGGQNERLTGERLKDPADVLVANPPRLRALLEKGQARLDDVRICVLDEADTLCAPGQRPDVDALLRALPATCQLALFSATLPEAMRQWALALPSHPVLLLSKDAHAAPESVKVHNLRMKPSERGDEAHDTLLAMPPSRRGIVFTNRRETADEAGALLAERGHSVVVIHGGQLPRERKAHLDRFRAGEGRILVTTELGGRGLDIRDLAWVMNWELPEKPSEYLHRIGRVGRQGAEGTVYNFVTDADGVLLKEIQRIASGGKLDTGEAARAPRERPSPAALKAIRDARAAPKPKAKATKARGPVKGTKGAARGAAAGKAGGKGDTEARGGRGPAPQVGKRGGKARTDPPKRGR